MSVLDEKLKNLVIYSQERFKFIENPDEYIKLECEDYKKSWENRRTLLHKKWFETNKNFQKRLEIFDKERNESCKSYADDIKKLAKEALVPKYVYYKGTKILVPDSFYNNFSYADTTTFLEYLEEEDRKKNIVTEEDREKARLLGCDVNYNYLQTLINKMTNVPDLVITIKHKDGMTMILRRTGEEEADKDISGNELIIEPLLVK